MDKLKKTSFAVVEFTVSDGRLADLFDDKIKKDLTFAWPMIIEIAAVKIEKGRITEHYTNFIGLSGVQAENLSARGDGMSFYGITPEHLIGAPSLREAVEKFYWFSRDCAILVRHRSRSHDTAFDIFQAQASSFGYIINNPVFGMTDIVHAAEVRELFKDKGTVCRKGILQLAEKLKHADSWTDTFAEYEIFFDPDSKDAYQRGRNDPLSWALAFARLFIAITNSENGRLEELGDDGTCPF